MLAIFLLVFFTQGVWAQTKDVVGLNVHWALGGFNREGKYQKRLRDGKTQWAREHFYQEVIMGEGQEGWLARYDYVMRQYKGLNIQVVGMLAYGRQHGDFNQPDLSEWEEFVTTVVRRYGKDVAVWEVWNEPDSPDFLVPNTAAAYIPILNVASKVIRKYDPHARILNGGLSFPNASFARTLYEQVPKDFDALAFHVYTCRQPNHNLLQAQLAEIDTVLRTYAPKDRVWVTEFGCSTGSSGITQEYATAYKQEVLDILFAYPWMERAFIYTIRNRDDAGAYENNFGLLDVDMEILPGWVWYQGLLRGPYDQKRVDSRTQTAQAKKLRKELEHYFGKGNIPVHGERWTQLVDAYVYGGYTVKAIAQGIRFGGKTVHPTILWKVWRKQEIYQDYINKDWTGKMFIHAYGKPRISAAKEQEKSEKLLSILKEDYHFDQLRINADNWPLLSKAYIYGNYPEEAIARVQISGGKTVHPEISWHAWRKRTEYQEGMKVPLP
ncbi:MAG: hypothetical protein A3B74_00735 [Candidatus Kerfeldbacteria bacterium RIFCSPHIGHO2_02_FULL_42_14]|uniref:Asl1-like glycosyl hydrolase catalytic domain-containing protein n=1 Tax=Candidatus Kerfeldbacteria bacterium RIFCSPHIGHO2_02_FULL_42_14 TaxID=1798540 RepID=A0A1G2ART2_9BACT|nr:MAG: hypothetical protein A3B74_00735 [Candidatus Kerfeldbacteria bacterium RIFCSPHIGHO2_02_FULL_42_14]OGY81883.1 MAG: hypothetical protein A3E60_00815 [Candidatus Kerfeldbacteria bacterium RIFCSPHIGHO2_12_FULL_42_13]OGY83482.1 MAG: hypothetical protein A3I91_02440 [Candidatus Kerfeldbacteria bacterium RIFCSPLOWO2_02_FULL_42_19]OGY86992.1 MAG: hypothetical protein A3G01_01770 [Candidatus Kerfeldbacteria bacterium RIFCSPLOWO2_12_FULL_43_9]